MSEWLTLGETTLLFHQHGEKDSRDKVKTLSDRGLLPCIRTAGGVRLFKSEDVEKFIAARKLNKKIASKLQNAA